MKQVKIDDILWVMQPEPYIITDDTDSSQIMVNCNAYKEFCTLNPSLNLTAWNYRLIRKWNPVYYEYWDDKEHSNFYFAETTQNISSFIDEDKTVTLQQLILPEDIDVSAIYKLGDEVISGNTFVLEDAGQYVVTGIVTDSSIYEDYEGSYIINYSKVKRNAILSFANATVDVSTWIDENYSGTIQTANNIPSGVDVKYYLDSSLLSSNNITLTTARNYSVTAKIQDDSIYNDTECSYIINYTKVKRDAVLSFANATVNTSSFVDETKTMTLQEVSGLPTGQTANYYLDSSLLGSNIITLSNAGNYIVSAKIENSSYYNDVSTSYTINYSQVKRDAVLSFANAVVDVSVEDVTSYSGQVQAVTGLPSGQSVNYYLDSSLLAGNTITINDLQEGLNTYNVTAKLENSSVYNDTSVSYTLNITMEISSYENKYLTFEALEDGTFKFAQRAVSYSVDNGKTWTELPANTSTGTIHQGEKILWKGTNNSYNAQIRASGNFNAEGNIMSMVYGDNFKNQNTFNTNNNAYVFSNFFQETKIVGAGNLKLPATTMVNSCYQYMFSNCKSLVTAPELPATSFAQNCYRNMFASCTSLVTAPELPGTILTGSCYQNMFSKCTSLNYIKAACPPNSESNKPYWVDGVSATGTYIISDPNYNINDGVLISYSCIPNGWVIKDYQGNTINPKRIVSFTNSNSVNLTVEKDEQRTLNYQIITNPAVAASEVVYSYSTDNINWTNTIPQSLDTTVLGNFTYYIKAEISNSSNYINKSEVYTYTYTVVDFGQISDYVRLDQIEDIDSLLKTDTLNFQYIIFDNSITQTNGTGVSIVLKNFRTGQTDYRNNRIQTKSNGQQITFNNTVSNIQDVGIPVDGHTGFYYYYFSDLMQIYQLGANVFKNMVYFRLPNYTPPADPHDVDDYSFSYSVNIPYEDPGDGKPVYYGLCGCPSLNGISRVPDFPNTVNIYIDDVLYQEPTFEGADISLDPLPPILKITSENEGEHTIKFVLKTQTNAAQALRDFTQTYFVDCNFDTGFEIGADENDDVLETQNITDYLKNIYISAQYPTNAVGAGTTEFEDIICAWGDPEHVYIDLDNEAYYDDGDGTAVYRTSDDEQIWPFNPDEEPDEP